MGARRDPCLIVPQTFGHLPSYAAWQAILRVGVREAMFRSIGRSRPRRRRSADATQARAGYEATDARLRNLGCSKVSIYRQ